MSEPDVRNISSGWEIPSEGYCDQPYVVVNADGTWTCVMTTGKGEEGDLGQHVVAFISADRGRTWQGPFDIEPASGPEASWVMPLRVPQTGRIYAFYTYNHDNLREVAGVDGARIKRVDTLGVYAYKYSDDNGRTWSSQRYEIPMRAFAIDRNNVYGGKVMFFWGVGKPFLHRGMAYLAASKVGGFKQDKGFFVNTEGVLFRCANLLDEPDPDKHEWETLPHGDVGIQAPPDAQNPIAEEHYAVPMSDGSLYCTYRTIDGWSCHAYSRDDGRTWRADWMTYTPGGRRVKNPRSVSIPYRFSNGKYLYWFCLNSGWSYGNRNPIWVCGGREQDGHIHWSQPEILLYDDKIGNRISYPDFIEDGGSIYVTETQKEIARLHVVDPKVLQAVWADDEPAEAVQDGLVLDLAAEQCRAGAAIDMPKLPDLHDEKRSGFALELWLRFDDLQPWQVIFDSRDDAGKGLLVQLTDRQTLKLHMMSKAYDPPASVLGNGMLEVACSCDQGLIQAGKLHQVLFIVDAGPKIISTMIDGQLCDGGAQREFGWTRFCAHLLGPNGADRAVIAGSLHGQIRRLRLYDRYLLSNEAARNYRVGVE